MDAGRVKAVPSSDMDVCSKTTLSELSASSKPLSAAEAAPSSKVQSSHHAVKTTPSSSAQSSCRHHAVRAMSPSQLQLSSKHHALKATSPSHAQTSSGALSVARTSSGDAHSSSDLLPAVVPPDHAQLHSTTLTAARNMSSSVEMHCPGSDAAPETRKTPSKRKRKTSGGGGKHHGHRHAHKKAKQDVSSTHAANNIMKFRLRGSVSDPLNLEGELDLPDDCSTCAPSPAPPENEELIPPVLITPQLSKDPLNLEGKVKNFPLLTGVGGGAGGGKAVTAAGQRRKPRRRTTSGSKPDENPAKPQNQGRGKRAAKKRQFRYGNYNRYYGYRNNGVNEVDPRLELLRRQWLEGQDCLDIGCNTGQVTIRLARDMCPKKIVGIDIDPKLVNTAWKNLHRSYTPSLAPDGRPFPSSLTMTRGPVDFPPSSSSSGGQDSGRGLVASSAGSSSHRASGTTDPAQHHRGRTFPHNLEFRHENYVPASDAVASSQQPEYDVILALSLSKWIHLNWGDAGIKRFFKKVYHHLRPGGRFILEPQPFSSYAKRKRINQEILRNYENIRFRPEEFRAYLLSPDVGFTSYHYLGVSDNKSKGFQRPIDMYVKARTSEATPTMPRPHSALSDASSTLDTSSSRLKSVVVVTTQQGE